MLDALFNKLYGKALRSIQKSIDEFNALGKGRYIRHSDLERWKSNPRTAVPDSLLFKILEALGANKQGEAIIREYRVIMNAPDRARASINSDYVKKALTEHAGFFNTVESNPLTDKQREACVIDEDFNLVLAGAGSGKTSVVVARAGLIERAGWADSGEILILAFGRKAAKETQERIQKRLGSDSQVLASTFHALGLKIIGQSRKQKPDLHKSAEDDAALLSMIDSYVEMFASKDGTYAADLVTYFRNFLCPVREPEQFDTIGAYYEHLDALDLRTFKGERVKSWQELHIANFLTANSIAYEYEPRYEHPTVCADFRQYHPDFRLCRSDAYIEHFGLNASGKPNPNWDTQEQKAYLEGVKWKRQLHRNKGTTLIETRSADFSDGSIWAKLSEELESCGEKLEPAPVNELLAMIREQSDAPKKLTYLIARFINLQKNNRLSIDQVERLTQQDSKTNKLMAALGFTPYLTARLRAFYRVYAPVFREYETELKREGCVDFNDMINEATDIVLSGAFRPKWKFILVDEFQDISASRAELVKALVENGPRTSLFCVGDDWQSIYRFTGSDIRYTNEFRSRFGPSATTALDKTFRFNKEISDVASGFITRNPEQQKKEVWALTTLEEPAITVILHGEHEENKAIYKALDDITEQIESGSTASVYLLGRFHFRAPEGILEFRANYPHLEISFDTIHASKGKEADFVILIAVNTERFGFPSEIDTDPIIELLLPPREPFAHAEERRLFYVALTRARRRSFMLTDRAKSSAFIKELSEEFSDSVTFYDADGRDGLPHSLTCPVCQSGNLKLVETGSGSFVGCSNYPRCKHTAQPCPHCHSAPVKAKDGKGFCTSCEKEVEICPRCMEKGFTSQLKKFAGSNGSFYGCSNYRGKEGYTCRYTRNTPLEHQSV